MPDDQNITSAESENIQADKQNPIPEENPSPTSPQEPTEPAPENTSISEPTEALPKAPESSPGDFEVKSADIPPSDSTPPEPQKTQENQAQIPLEPADLQASPASSGTGQAEAKPVTPQIPANEAFEPELETKPDPEKPRISYLKSQKWSELLVMARNAIQFRKRKKLDRVMTLFDKKKNGSTSSPRVTNDEVEKFLHVSDATASRYLSELEKQGRIKQEGKTGRGVSYLRI